MTGSEELAEVTALCPAAACISEGGHQFVSLPGLRIAVGTSIETRDALLTLGPHNGYASRLYLSAPIAGCGINWTTHTVLGRCWHTPSWNYVQSGRPIEMLQQHLKVYR